jgi:hypothetical protein
MPCALQGGGLPLLLELLESKHINLQHNAAFALYGISDNEDNIPCIIQVGPSIINWLSVCFPAVLYNAHADMGIFDLWCVTGSSMWQQAASFAVRCADVTAALLLVAL